MLDAQIAYKPFRYQFAYDAWLQQQRIHWLPEEVTMFDDIKDWNIKLNPKEKHLLTQIFRFFTQADIDVNNCYMKHYSSIFKATEIQMMLSAFSNMETIHIAAYSMLIDTLGMDEVEYSAFMSYQEMRDKHEYMQQFNMNNNTEIAVTMAVFGAFTEGLVLFASFAILLNFPRFGKMKGMGQIITWSIRDETLHTESIIKLYNQFLYEFPHIHTSDFRARISNICREVVEIEDKFINLVFELGGVEGLTADDIKAYIRYIADIRLGQLNLPPIYNIKKNPLPWLHHLINASEFSNFFEQRVTEYSKGATRGEWNDVFEN